MSDGMEMETDSRTDHRVCTSCDREFSPQQAHRVRVQESTAEFTCPWCKQMVTADPPTELIERPPAIVGHTSTTDEQGLPTARLFFEGGAWLQFREVEEGWVREEMFNADGEEIESFAAEFDRGECDTPAAYLREEANRYPTYTKAGLRVQRPHIAAVLLHGQ